MNRIFSMSVMLGAVAIFVAAVPGSADEGAQAKPALTCPVSGKAVNPEITVEYRGGTIALCCAGCVKPFSDNTEKYATKANLQLAQSGQAKQVGCPITGRNLNPDQSLTIEGVEVAFCCGGCKGKVAKAEDQVEAVFGTGFDKAYKVSEKE